MIFTSFILQFSCRLGIDNSWVTKIRNKCITFITLHRKESVGTKTREAEDASAGAGSGN